MLVSAEQLSNYNIPSDFWFPSRTNRNSYFSENPSALVSGIYCAISDSEEDYEIGKQDSTAQVWELEQYNGINWQVYTVDENYNLVITTAGLEALANVVNGATTLSFSGIKIIDTCLTNPSTPLAMWTDNMFSTAGNVVFSVGAQGDTMFVHNGENDLKQILTWRYNSGTGGLQYTITLPAEGLGSVSNQNEPIWNIGAIGLYVKDPDTLLNVLFGIATLQTPAQKIGNDVNTIGNSFRFYINTVLTNLGYVQDLSVLQEHESSVPEVDNETFLQYPSEATQRPFNLYLVKNLYGTGIPALATQTQNPSSSSVDIEWNYFQPSDNYLKVDPSLFADDVFNYAFIYWDSTAGKYKLGEGSTASTELNLKKPIGIRVGNSIVFSGEIGNNAETYNYDTPELTLPGSGYTAGDQLLLLYAVNGNTSIVFKILVTSVTGSGAIENYTFVGPRSGNVLIGATEGTLEYKGKVENVSDLPASGNTIGDYYIVTSVDEVYIWQRTGWVESKAVITAIYDPRSMTKSGAGAQFRVSCTAIEPATWELTLNVPYYCGSGQNAGKPVATKNDSFLGWATSPKSLRLGLDLRNEASYVVYGTTRYATNAEVSDVYHNGNASETTAVTPKELKNNFLQTTLPPAGNAGSSSSNPIIVNSYTRFNTAIVGKGYTTAPTDETISFHGIAYRAQWADLGEYYESDKYYEPGTLITFGEGDAEITAASSECNGVISTNPGYQLGEKKNDNYQLVALCGRVPVIFDGKCTIKKGDKVYLSKLIKGCASTVPNGKAIGKVIERHPGTMNKVECVVKIDF